jgi:autotransporter-associated beta strand protein
MRAIKAKLAGSCALIAALLPATANAGHMFTQASSNTPTWIQQGQGIAIQQYGHEGGSGSGNIDIYFETNLGTAPESATQTGSDWYLWSAGDVMQLNFALDGGSQTYTIAYDAANGTCAYDYCGVTGSSIGITEPELGQISSLPAHSGERNGGGYTASDTYFGWSIVAVSGEFSLGGYRIYTSAGTIDGTGAGPLDQSSVVSAEDAVSGGGGTSGGNRPITNADDVIGGLGTTTTYQFDGGNLITDADVSSNFTITDNGGSMSVDSGATQTMSGTLADETGASGAFTKAGAGTLVLSGTNTHSGGTTVAGGTLQVSSDSNLGASSGGVTLDGGVLATTTDMTTSRGFTVGSNGGGVAVAADTTLTLAGTSTGTGALTSSGAGTLNITGSFSAGSLNQSGGNLIVNGTLAANTTVAQGAVVSGSGTIDGDLTNSGTLAAGNSPGTMTVNGDVTLNSTSVLEQEIDGLTYSAAGGAGSYDRIVVTGAENTFTADGEIDIALRGLSGDANNDFTPSIGDEFRIVTTENASGVAGAFATVTNPTDGLTENTRFDVVYGADYVDLVVTPDSFATFVSGFNIDNLNQFALAFDGVRPIAGSNDGDDLAALTNGFYGLDSDELSVAMLQMSGQIHAFALSDARSNAVGGANTVFNEMRSGIRTGSNLWFDASGHTISYDEDAFATASDSIGSKFWWGTDIHSDDNITVGFAGGYTQSEVDAGIYGTSETASLGVALYGFGSNGNWVYDGVLALDRGDISGSRTTDLSTGSVTNTFETSARSTTLKARLGYRGDVSENFSVTTWFGAEVNKTDAEGYTEAGSSVTALTVDEQSYTTTRFNLGVEMDGELSEDARWNFNVGATRTASGDEYTTRDMSIHGAEWTVSEQQYGDTVGYANLGINVAANDNVNYWGSVGVTKANGSLGRQAAIGVDFRW